MGRRGPQPDWDIGAFVVALEFGATNAELADRFGITIRAVEGRLRRLRMLGEIPPAAGRDVPAADLVRQREANERARQEARRAHEERSRRFRARREAEAVQRALEADAQAMETLRRAVADAERERWLESQRLEAERWHAERKARERGPDAPILDLFLS